MVRRVVVDSSANLFVAGTQDIVSVPMKVRVGEREFPDDANLDVGELGRGGRIEYVVPEHRGMDVCVRGRGRDRRSCPHE